LIKQHRSFALHALALSAQLALLVTASSSAVRAASVPVNGDVTMSASRYSVAESAGSVTITLRRNGGTSGALSVTYYTVAETALVGKQFTAATGTLTWANGDASNKTFSIPILKTTPSASAKYFAVRLTPATGTIIGSPSNAIVNIVGGTPTITKSIREWVSCNDTIDETAQLESALLSAANNAFTLIVDCPVLFHTGAAASRSIAVPDGVTLSFQGAGEFLTASNGPPALMVAHPSEVTFIDWNLIN
jgi:Calx-beta domain